MLTTTLDGLWALQVLSGIEVVAPELGLRPHLPSVETAADALAHPVAAELIDAHVIDASGAVDTVIREWLTVLARRDVALLLCAQTPAAPGGPQRALIVRFAQWWVALERNQNMVRLSGIGTATTEEAAARLISSEIQRLCGQLEPAAVRPVTLDIDRLLAHVRDRDSLRQFLIGQRLDPDQIVAVMSASDTEESAQASIAATQAGVTGAPARSYVGDGVVTVIDTPQGRMLAEHVVAGGKRWMLVGPGTPANIATAIVAMTRRLPSENDWYSHRKVV